MNRKQLPANSRRHSVPVPAIMPNLAFGGQSRTFPEGTDTFQKALEDLYISDSTQPYVHYRRDGLKGIQEGNEEEYISDESSDSERKGRKFDGASEMSTPPLITRTQIHGRRRHSLPACFLSEASDKDLEKYPLLKEARKKSAKTILKEHSDYMKEYFVKHGHWPSSNTPHKHVKRDVSNDNSNLRLSPRPSNNRSRSPRPSSGKSTSPSTKDVASKS